MDKKNKWIKMGGKRYNLGKVRSYHGDGTDVTLTYENGDVDKIKIGKESFDGFIKHIDEIFLGKA